jgi:hypothetical protein
MFITAYLMLITVLLVALYFLDVIVFAEVTAHCLAVSHHGYSWYGFQ